jgi:hypothetical protein
MKNHFLVKNKMLKPVGLENTKIRGYGVMPIGVMKKSIQKHLGRGTTSILLSDDVGGSNIIGYGYGVKMNNPNLIQKLGNLSIGSNKPRKNVRLIL